MTKADKGTSFSLRGDLLRSSSANLLFALSQATVLVTVAQLGTMRDVGLVTLATAIVTPIFSFSGPSLREARSVDNGEQFTTADYYSLRMATTAAASILCLLVLVFFYGLETGDVAFAVIAYVATKIFHTQSNLNYGVFQRFGRIDLVATSNYLRAVVGGAAFIIAFWATKSVGWAFLSQAAAWAGGLIFYEARCLRRIGQSRSLSEIGKVDRKAVFLLFMWMLPLAFSGLFQTLTLSVPRLALARLIDIETLGLFGAIAYFQTASQLLTTSIGQAAVNRLSKAYAAGNKKRFIFLSTRLTLLNASIGAVILGFVWLAGEPLIATLYGPEYVNNALLLLVGATVAVTLVVSVFQFGMSAGLQFGLRLKTNIFTFCVAVLLALIIIPTHGLVGAGWVMLLSASVRLVVSVFAWWVALKRIETQVDV